MNNRIFGAVALLISLAIFFVYVSPAWNGPIAATKAAIAADNQALAAAADFTKRENELAKERSDIPPAYLTALDTLLPASVDNVGLILDLTSLASRSGLTLSNIDVASQNAQSGGQNSSQTALSPVGQVDLTLSALGAYTSMKRFLEGIERSERLLDVRTLSVKGSTTGVYSYAMSVRIYWLR